MEDHNRKRGKLCLVCMSKGKVKINDKLEKVIRDYLIEGYTTENLKFPSSLCPSCASRVYEYAKGDFRKLLPEWYDFTPMKNFRMPRQGPCECHLCEKAATCHLFGAKTSRVRKIGRPKDQKIKPTIVMLCAKCMSPANVQTKHICNESSTREGARSMIRSMPDKNRKRLAYELIREEVKDSRSGIFPLYSLYCIIAIALCNVYHTYVHYRYSIADWRSTN